MPRSESARQTETRSFRARADALADAAGFVETGCQRLGCTRETALRLLLIIEELFTNTVKYGSAREPAEIRITLDADRPGMLAIAYEDNAPAHDPLANLGEQPLPDDPVTQLPVGGVGLRLVARLGGDLRYVYENGWNRISFSLPRA